MDHGHGMYAGWNEFWAVVPVLGFLLLMLALLAAGGWWLWRQGLLRPAASRQVAPEERARAILAERFAHGDLSPEEFMERASLLNWTPGIPDAPERSLKPGKRRP